MLGYLGINSRVDLVREKHLPSGECELLICLGGEFRVLDPAAPGGWTTHHGASVIGVHDRPVITEAPAKVSS